jgi:hypothetical protein
VVARTLVSGDAAAAEIIGLREDARPETSEEQRSGQNRRGTE